MQEIKEELDIIADLMGKLQEKMAYGEDDFYDRLGKEKGPKPEMGMKIEIEKEEMPEDMEEPEEMDEEDSLKSRLMKLRS